jgi:plasmid replication initiation protein
MADISHETEEINTLESLGVTPRFVLQHNAISRSIQNLSATAKKLTAMAMALLPADLSTLTASFSYIEFCKAIGYTKSGESFEYFKKAVNECMDSKISIEMKSTKTGKRIWKRYTWFTYSEIDEGTGLCVMKFSPELAKVLIEMKRVYAKINLQDFGKLQSQYALRYFEMAKSYESLAGKDGNQRGVWYFERSVPELRQLLGIDPDAYPVTNVFKKKVIEDPVKELNSAGVGVEIQTEGIKQGRVLKGIRFNCVKAARTTAIKSGRRKKAEASPPVELLEPSPKAAGNRVETELQHLQELYPDEFAELYEKALEETPTLGGHAEGFRKIAAAGKALALLRKRHGIVK